MRALREQVVGPLGRPLERGVVEGVLSDRDGFPQDRQAVARGDVDAEEDFLRDMSGESFDVERGRGAY